MGAIKNTFIGIGLAAVVAGGVGTCTVINHFWEGSRDTRRIATPDYVLENYRWFKNQSSAVEQVKAQIESTSGEIDSYVKDFKETPRANWPFDAREELARKEAVLRGYISQYNMLTKDYNARSSDVTRHFTEGEKPKELKSFLKIYEPLK